MTKQVLGTIVNNSLEYVACYNESLDGIHKLPSDVICPCIQPGSL